MFFNLKYHIASLVAVFLALGLGILIGGAVPVSDALVGQQQQMTSALEVQLGALRQKNEFLQARLCSLEMDYNIQRQFENQVFPALVADRLKGRSIAIISSAGHRLPDQLAASLEAAGASIHSTTNLNGLQARNREELLKKLGWQEMDDRKMTARLAAEVAGAVLTGDTGVLSVLADSRVISSGGRYGDPLDGVVLVGGSPDKRPSRIELVDYPIIDLFKSRGISVYGVEESCAVNSYMREYQKKGITTVDNIDTAPGRLSLVYAISGSPGRYGVKPSAQRLLPAVAPGGNDNDS